jgi:hypothetical protein
MEGSKMMRTRVLTPPLLAALAVGLVSATLADRLNYGSGYYNQHPNYHGDFTNSDAWSATIVGRGGDSFEVTRYGERVHVRLLDGRPRLFVGQRVRIVPFRRDGRYEIAELRLPDLDFRPVATVRYIEERVIKEYEVYRYDGRYGSGYGTYGPRGYLPGRGSGWGIDVRIDNNPPRRYHAPDPWRGPERKGKPSPRQDWRRDDGDGRKGPQRSFKAR